MAGMLQRGVSLARCTGARLAARPAFSQVRSFAGATEKVKFDPNRMPTPEEREGPIVLEEIQWARGRF